MTVAEYIVRFLAAPGIPKITRTPFTAKNLTIYSATVTATSNRQDAKDAKPW